MEDGRRGPGLGWIPPMKRRVRMRDQRKGDEDGFDLVELVIDEKRAARTVDDERQARRLQKKTKRRNNLRRNCCSEMDGIDEKRDVGGGVCWLPFGPPEGRVAPLAG